MALAGDPRGVSVDVASIGDNTILAAIPGKRIAVVGYALIASGSNAVRWKSGSTSLSGAMALPSNGGLVACGGADTMQFITNAGEALVLNLSAAIQVSGHLTYQVVGR